MSAIYPLIHERLPFSQYIELPGEHSTSLRRALVSPLKYKHHKTHSRTDTADLVVGRATHTAVLEMQQFLREYVLQPEEIKVRRGAAWEKFLADNPGKTVLKSDQYDEAIAMSEAIRSHAVAGPLFFGSGRNELSIQWRHESGTLCKARIDRLGSALIDVKTARDISPHGFATASFKYGYHVQAAFYADACKAAGLGVFPVRFVVVDKQAPHDVVVYDVDDAMIDKGREEYERALLLIAQCTRDNKWPGQAPSEPVLLKLPAWAAPEFNEDEAIAWGNEEVIQ